MLWLTCALTTSSLNSKRGRKYARFISGEIHSLSEFFLLPTLYCPVFLVVLTLRRRFELIDPYTTGGFILLIDVEHLAGDGTMNGA